jgi:hypothetical protein
MARHNVRGGRARTHRDSMEPKKKKILVSKAVPDTEVGDAAKKNEKKQIKGVLGDLSK